MSLQLEKHQGVKTMRRNCPCSILGIKEDGGHLIPFAETLQRSVPRLSLLSPFQYFLATCSRFLRSSISQANYPFFIMTRDLKLLLLLLSFWPMHCFD